MTAIHLATADTETDLLLRDDAHGVATLTLNRRKPRWKNK